MKAAFINSLLLVLTLCAAIAAADNSELKGTWSGNWTTKDGVPEAITIELKEDDRGTLTGRFLTPVPMEFKKVSFNSRTNMLQLEAFDQKSGKNYRIEATMKGTELIGTLGMDGVPGNLRLIKWTFFGR